jgi:hypothetical protein
MKNIYFLLFVIATSLFAGCTSDFEEINENPNAPEQVSPEFLLTNVISVQLNENTYNQGLRLNGYLSQFVSSIEFERIDRYELGSNSGYWNLMFRLLSDLDSMQDLEGYNEAYDAVATILRSYLFSQLTDMWCDVPYTEAIQAKDGVFQPKYDQQEDIYTDPETGILAQLESAAAVLTTTQSSIKGDVMFNNDLQLWARLANSLQLRYRLRISKRVTDFTKIQQLADGGMLMQSNSQNAVLPYLAAAPNQFPLFSASVGIYRELPLSTTLETTLKSWDDPRLMTFFKPTNKSLQPGSAGPEFKGLDNGQNRETIAAAGTDLSDISQLAAMFRDVPDGVDAQLMQYSEVQFALAEAAQRGFITGSAAQYYETAIRATFEYYNTAVPSDYFTRSAVALNGNQEQNLEKILTQKWFSLFNVGHEAWFNIRRTGYPVLTPGPDNLNDDKYPSRYLYPESEQAVNATNYQEAASRVGGDDINTKCWWEKN